MKEDTISVIIHVIIYISWEKCGMIEWFTCAYTAGYLTKKLKKIIICNVELNIIIHYGKNLSIL